MHDTDLQQNSKKMAERGNRSRQGSDKRQRQGNIAEYIQALMASEQLGPQITSHTVLPEAVASCAETIRPWPRAMADVLSKMGIASLYTHQAAAIDALRAGQNVVVATPTASGKSLVYTLPVLERFLQDPDAKSLFLFPLKALAQDQLASFRRMTAHWPEDARPCAHVYDGDTTAHFRRKIRENVPPVLLTNPEMLHLSLLPHHHLWSTLFAGLSFVVVDEVHTYRGVLGSHMAQLFRRLLRVAALYGSHPVFCFCSATVGNPAELAEALTGIAPVPVLQSGAPQGKRHYIFLNPLESHSSVAIKLLKSALARNLRTIVYCQSRRMTELISLWASEQSGPYAGKISAYRAGFLPEERRAIESRMAGGDLLAVITTSALELGIDIGSLDLCILVGYPGTVMATLQRGGRVGRSSQESAVVLVAGEDALDQYIVRHAEEFFSRPAECAVLNPENLVILERHLECAAAEIPLRPGRMPDAAWFNPAVQKAASNLEYKGLLLRSADGSELLAARKRPQRHVALRGSGNTVSIEDTEGRLIGSVDGIRALREAHPGSIYIHQGRHFEITELDLAAGRALARPFRPSWYTRTRGQKDTAVLSVDANRRVAGIAVQRGRLRVTDMVTGYEKRAVQNGQLLSVVPLELPPQVFETEGFWFQIPRSAQEIVEAARFHFMGSIHALEHAAIGILPLLVMCDRNDLGGISTPMHLQTGRPTVFIYDGLPGGAGLSRSAFEQAEELFEKVREVIGQCPCELGCPSCVHSPKCGSGNRPIDKEGALRLLELMLRDSEPLRMEAEDILRTPVTGLEAVPNPTYSGVIADDAVFPSAPGGDCAAEEAYGPSNRQVSGKALISVSTSAPERSFAAVETSGVSSGVLAISKGFMEARQKAGFEHGSGDFASQGAAGEPGSSSKAWGTLFATGGAKKHGIGECAQQAPGFEGAKVESMERAMPDGSGGYVVLDVETRLSAADVGGWNRADRMGVSVAVVYDSRTDSFTDYPQEAIPQMAAHLASAPLVVGFNLLRFDYKVLTPHAPGFSFATLPTLDLLVKVHEQLSYRISLDNLATATLGAQKSADGLLALQWWKEGRVAEIAAYCRQDVALTRDLFLFGRENGYLLFTNKAKQKVRVRAQW